MPWTKTDYPNSMKNLRIVVRNKAIEIANALLNEGKMTDEGIIIATATSRAKDWAANRGIKIENSSHEGGSTDIKKHGEDRYVTPLGKTEWAVKEEGAKKVEQVFKTKDKAVKRAVREAKNANASVTIQKRTGKIAKKISYNPHNTGKR
jgi:uncharacterized protein YdaT